jgi:hypothetical protein
MMLALGMALFPWGRAYAAPSPPQTHQPGPAESLYLQLSGVGLDPARVFKVRDSSLDRAAIHISLEDGTLAFTRDVMGRITGAFFEGDGEVLLIPPNEVERKSLSLFTGMAILEERFSTAYFRFNDNTAAELRPGLRAPDDAAGFVAQWNETARNLAQGDAMRLLVDFSEMLPKGDGTAPQDSPDASRADPAGRILHARLQGTKLGVFDVVFDANAGEQVEAGQAKAAADGTVYYDVWTSFSTDDARPARAPLSQTQQALSAETETREDPIFVRNYIIDAEVRPPKELDAKVELDLDVRHDGSRFLAFELSRYLKIQSVEADGRAVEFVQNPAVEGTRLARSGNDIVALVLPQPVRKGQKIKLRFVYVGARGNWYPNRGLVMSDFDLTFRYPPGWTLLATGKPEPAARASTKEAGDGTKSAEDYQVAHWVSERPIPVAGFDLGQYVRATAQAGNVNVDTYATIGVERNFPTPREEINPEPGRSRNKPSVPSIAAVAPSPARNASAVADLTAQAIRYYAARFGPFPYSKLALTQLPGRESQGWPGLIFLSSYAFLTQEERRELHMGTVQELMDQQVPAHEAAHQWWGDLVTWRTYRDQWLSEGLANYSALMILQEKNPTAFRQIMDKYREDLVQENKDGNVRKDAGPVTLGSRLLSSHFPQGYESISYGRGTWLFHMLRSTLEDAATEAARKDAAQRATEEPFVRSLRKVRERYEGKAITTRELLDVFAEDLPPSLRYEGKASLDWFLDGWVNGTSLPKLKLQGVKFTETPKGVSVTGVIRQEDAEENLVTSVPIYAVVSGRAPVLLGRVFADGAESRFHLTAPPGTRKLLLDPNGTILSAPK